MCEPHLTAFLAHNLGPKAFQRLAKDAGDPEQVFQLHGDFYSPVGRTCSLTRSTTDFRSWMGPPRKFWT
jgi:hypothetical protein